MPGEIKMKIEKLSTTPAHLLIYLKPLGVMVSYKENVPSAHSHHTDPGIKWQEYSSFRLNHFICSFNFESFFLSPEITGNFFSILIFPSFNFTRHWMNQLFPSIIVNTTGSQERTGNGEKSVKKFNIQQ